LSPGQDHLRSYFDSRKMWRFSTIRAYLRPDSGTARRSKR
jgi:hypothetical protein